MAKEFQLVAGHVALDFANTLDNRYDPERRLELLPSYERFVTFVRQSGIISEQQARRLIASTGEGEARRVLEQAIELREALQFLFVAVAHGRRPPPRRLGTLNSFLETRVPAAITWTKSGFIWVSRDLAETPASPLWPIAEAAAALLASPDCANVRECGAATCRWLFLDHSKNHTRRWCDMRICGNREKARQFQARQRLS